MSGSNRNHLGIAGLLLVLALTVASCGSPNNGTTSGTATSTPEGAAANAAADPVARGKYLTTIMSCGDCHTPGTLYGAPDFDRTLSGSELGWAGPWGVSYPRNLTPDMETGIGAWSEDDIVKAIQTGYRPDGTQLSPPMPWPNFANLSHDDAIAIAKYLKSLPPVHHKVPDKLAPGVKPKVTPVVIPAPPAWDAPKKAAS
ncbi:MAG TPA: c-type cytochrome [Candidatus Eisenbacteria bacterium]